MRAREFLTESTNIASAEQVWDYIGGIHPADQQGGGFLKSLVMLNPQYELKRIPLTSLHIPNDEDDGNDPYGRAMYVDVDHAKEYSQYQIDKKPLVVDSQGHILDGAHRAWAASELLNKKDIMAWVPVKTRANSPQDLEIRKKFTKPGVTENMDHSQDGRAVEELKSALLAKQDQLQSATDDQVYDIIDKIMTRIARSHSISGQKLHDMWVDRYKQIPDTWVMNEGLEQEYLSQIPNLTWKPVSRSVWNTIQDEGLDEEQDAPKHTDWVMASLSIDPKDAQALQAFDSDAIEDFNRFDIHLKSRYPGLTDLIDYDNGTVTIVKPIQMQGVAEGTEFPGDFKLMGQNLFLKNLARNLKQRYPEATVKLLNDRVTAYHNDGDDEALSVMGTEVMDSGYIGVGLDDAFTESFQGVLVPTIKQTTEQLLAANPGTKPALFLSTDNWNPDAWTHIAAKLGYRLVADDESLDENFADGKGPGRPGDSVRHGIPKKATMAELEKASHAKGRKGQLARWQLNMRRGHKK